MSFLSPNEQHQSTAGNPKHNTTQPNHRNSLDSSFLIHHRSLNGKSVALWWQHFHI